MQKAEKARKGPTKVEELNAEIEEVEEEYTCCDAKLFMM